LKFRSGALDRSDQGKIRRDRNLRIIFSVTLISVLGVASITPAFPRIIRDLGIEPRQVGLLITTFTFPGMILAPFLGVLADRYGRKRILVPSLLLFGLAGSACGFAGSFHVLLVLRFFQGTGAAALASLAGTIIGDLFPGKERATAMGYNATVLSVGTASYPAIGGAMALFGWYYPFFLPLLALPVAYAALFHLENPEPKGGKNFVDYLKGAWGVLKNKDVLGVFLVGIATFIILYGSLLTFFPLMASARFGASTMTIGLLMSVMSVSTALTSTQMGRLSAKFGEKNLIKAAFLFYGAALLLIPAISSVSLYALPAVIFGLGHGMNIPAIMSLMAGFAPIEHRGVIMSVNGMVLRLGQTAGPLVMGVAYTLWGIAGPFYAGAVLALAVSIGGVIAVKY